MSSSITLSAATRQNLLSLQDTANLLSTTQTRLSTGKEVNSALDNPANFFTAQGLTQRSGTLNGLLDGISNGIQTIQAAATGLTNLQKLTDQLKSTAQQATQATSAVTAKATLTTKALNGAIDTNLLSTGATQAQGAAISAAASATREAASTTATYSTNAATPTAVGNMNVTIDGVDVSVTAGNYTAASLATAITNQLTAAGSTTVVGATGGNLSLQGSTDGGKISVAGPDAATLFGTITTTTAGVLLPTAGTKMVGLGFAAGDNIVVNGYNVTVAKSDTLTTFASKVSTATSGDVSASYDATAKKFTFTAKDAKTQVNLANGSTASSLVSTLGYSTTTNYAAGLGAPSSSTNADLYNKSLTVTTGSGTNAKSTTVNFGSGSGQVATLDQLNVALASANAQATMDATGRLSISTTNDSGSQNLSVSGTAAGSTNAFLTTSAVATLGGDGLAARNKLVSDYNNLLNQIDQMSNDSSFNGINLLKGDQMKINFNEDSSSNISIKGVATSTSSLKLNSVTTDDFKDNASINKVMDTIKSAGTTLKSQAATFASNLSVVQNRQDFTKNLANVLDTGAANLTNADMNEEAANSQALSTRNSLGISALSLANQAQQGILQLLR